MCHMPKPGYVRDKENNIIYHMCDDKDNPISIDSIDNGKTWAMDDEEYRTIIYYCPYCGTKLCAPFYS